MSFVLSLLVTISLMPLCVRYAAQMGLIDQPDQRRRLHTTPIPRNGGIAFTAGVMAACLIWMPLNAHAVTILLCAGLIFVAGTIDDRFHLRVRWKLLGQVLAATLFVVFVGPLPKLPLFGIDLAPMYLTVPVTLIFLVGTTNAINMSDGLDGLAAGNCLLSLLMLAFVGVQFGMGSTMVPAMALAGGLIGFLRFNAHPARIFMGDSGSQFLGFTAAALCIWLLQHPSAAISPAFPLLLFGLPILDCTWVMVSRGLAGRSLFGADKNHIHHRLLALGFRHYEVVVTLYILQAVAVALAYVLRFESDGLLIGVFVVYVASIVGLISYASAKGYELRSKTQKSTERRNLWLREFQWLHRHAGKVVAVAAAIVLIACALAVDPPPSQLTVPFSLVVTVLTAVWVWLPSQTTVTTRLILYLASAATFGGLLPSEIWSVQAFQWSIDVWLLGMGGLLALVMRLTRKDLFRLDSQDYLILLLVVAASLLPFDQFGSPELARSVLRFCVILYACEFALARDPSTARALTVTGLVTSLILVF